MVFGVECDSDGSHVGRIGLDKEEEDVVCVSNIFILCISGLVRCSGLIKMIVAKLIIVIYSIDNSS